jgi:hypothetical protein
MVALTVRVPMTHNQRRWGVGASRRVSTWVVMRRVSLERSSLDVARVSPRFRVVLSPPEMSGGLQGLRLAKTRESGASLPGVGRRISFIGHLSMEVEEANPSCRPLSWCEGLPARQVQAACGDDGSLDLVAASVNGHAHSPQVLVLNGALQGGPLRPLC